MTRINIGIDVKNLTDEHLLAEHREIKRICSRLTKRNGDINGAPDKFTLGTGHELFFLRYGEYTYRRYQEIHYELIISRKFINVSDYSKNWLVYENHINLWNNLTPTKDDIILITNRIVERILGSSKEYFHHYGKRITKDEAVELISKQLNLL